MDFEVELDALYRNLTADRRIIYITQKQAVTLASLMSGGLESNNRAVRIEVLRLIAEQALEEVAGAKLNSTKNLTSPMASFLINYFRKNENSWELADAGRMVLSLAESFVKEEVM